ncbi:MAG: quinone-dependent dihydroorotate dehydrogenase [Chthoniobacterales bacterium]
MSLYTLLARPLLFRLPAETAHEVSMKMLALAASVLGRSVSVPTGRAADCFGLTFPNAVGLAAGMDKNAVALPAWPLMGFGFVEIGTVTARAQPGNAKPRVFRLPRQRALINRLGFNNEGAAAVAERLARWKASGRWPRVPVGINLGKSRATPLAHAADDYAESFRLLREHGDYFAVNVSSPNTPGLRELQAVDHLRGILRALHKENPSGRPILVKIAPDLAGEDIDGIVSAGEEEGAAGWIATNTTIDHSSVPAGCDEEGGLSGEPLRDRATRVVRQVAARATRPVIGVGGVSDAGSAREKLSAGAALVQLYTGLVYEGPALPRQIARGL